MLPTIAGEAKGAPGRYNSLCVAGFFSVNASKADNRSGALKIIISQNVAACCGKCCGARARLINTFKKVSCWLFDTNEKRILFVGGTTVFH